MCKSNKTIIVELCNKSKMPTNGWIQACLTCDNFTSKLFDYMVVTKKTKLSIIKHIYVKTVIE